jgi:hypothetical protein
VKQASEGRRRRGGIVALVAAVSVVVFAVAGGAGLAGNGKKGSAQVGMGQYQYGGHGRFGKVTLCHKGRSITVGFMASLKGHRKHGDALGACVGRRGKKHGESRAHGKHGKVFKIVEIGKTKSKGRHGQIAPVASSQSGSSGDDQGDDDDDDDRKSKKGGKGHH